MQLNRLLIEVLEFYNSNIIGILQEHVRQTLG